MNYSNKFWSKNWNNTNDHLQVITHSVLSFIFSIDIILHYRHEYHNVVFEHCIICYRCTEHLKHIFNHTTIIIKFHGNANRIKWKEELDSMANNISTKFFTFALQVKSYFFCLKRNISWIFFYIKIKDLQMKNKLLRISSLRTVEVEFSGEGSFKNQLCSCFFHLVWQRWTEILVCYTLKHQNK